MHVEPTTLLGLRCWALVRVSDNTLGFLAWTEDLELELGVLVILDHTLDVLVVCVKDLLKPAVTLGRCGLDFSVCGPNVGLSGVEFGCFLGSIETSSRLLVSALDHGLDHSLDVLVVHWLETVGFFFFRTCWPRLCLALVQVLVRLGNWSLFWRIWS